MAIMKRKRGYEKANQEHKLYNCLDNRGYFTEENELNFKLWFSVVASYVLVYKQNLVSHVINFWNSPVQSQIHSRLQRF